MKDPSYKLITSDLDSTLITDTLILPEVNACAVTRARSAGCHFAICSGRSTHSIKRYEELLGLMAENTYGISFNGSVVYETLSRNKIRDIQMSHDLVQELTAQIIDNGATPWVYSGDDIYIVDMNEWAHEYSRRINTNFHVLESFRHFEGEASKIIVPDHNTNLKRLEAHFIHKTDTRFNSFFSADFLYEFTAQYATKGEALLFLADYLGVPVQQTIAIGDNLNDVHMVKVAGLGVAVKNAKPELKTLAAYITERDCGQGAVAEVIDKFVL